MVYRMRQWLEWVFTGENEAVAGERTVPALIKAFPDAAQLTFSDLSYWTALVRIPCPLHAIPAMSHSDAGCGGSTNRASDLHLCPGSRGGHNGLAHHAHYLIPGTPEHLIAVQVDMYSFSFEHPVNKVFHRFLVPALDMVNHAFDANAEVRITRDGELFAARALKHIK